MHRCMLLAAHLYDPFRPPPTITRRRLGPLGPTVIDETQSITPGVIARYHAAIANFNTGYGGRHR